MIDKERSKDIWSISIEGRLLSTVYMNIKESDGET